MTAAETEKNPAYQTTMAELTEARNIPHFVQQIPPLRTNAPPSMVTSTPSIVSPSTLQTDRRPQVRLRPSWAQSAGPQNGFRKHDP